MNSSKLNSFLFFKLPSAWWCGVRVHKIDQHSAETRVRHRWFNQNPFGSLFWAVQGMAAELSTGVLVMQGITKSEQGISMLVANNKASFSKKAKGQITFSCDDGELVAPAVARTLETGEGQTFWMRSVGKDEAGDTVATFEFEWTIRARRN
ncbi:DUF4442 domain-containing protein [Zeaxanthinibacter enoshimensis]|uniref:Acyl-coenzyme A thioesterase PaaI-like protein n=1 Tax=Zeaxanthinibacter enoshimensis TaxID=392009 RepID=A0A4R6TJG7_9FLAO|nr:DUF4442 domain-containing protein [Zeaxanthinibacter enoshimensis]TDQ29379.1 acyl-coenzyme A thioesterase PaaI-like protein [Zeaxanthinibacter enoshimensis]